MRTELKIGFVAALVVAAGAIYFVVNQGPESGGDLADTLPLDAPAKDVAPASKKPAVTPGGQPPRVVKPGRSPAVATPRSNTGTPATGSGTRTTKPPVTEPLVAPPKVTPPPAGDRRATVPPSGPADGPVASRPAAEPEAERNPVGDLPLRGPGVAPPTPRDTTRRTLPPPAAEVRRHTIVAGESLWTIAVEYYDAGHLWPRIKEANPGLDEGRLEVGRSIVIPPKEGAVAGHPTTAPTTQPAARRHVYVVEIGDTLTSIARGVLGDPNRWDEIYELNRDKLASPDVVPVGLELKLPAR